MKINVVVVGGGISGLTVARALLQKGDFRVTLLEASDRLGGVIRTLRQGGLSMEAGADAFGGGEPAMIELCRDLGLGEGLVECGASLDRVSLFRNKKATPIDLSFSRPFELLLNPALSPGSRLRLLLEPFAPSGESEDESVASFVGRRLGKGFLEELGRPLIRGLLMAEPGDLGLREYFPKWKTAEDRHGGLARAALAEFLRDPLSHRGPFSGRKKKGQSPFYTVRGGLDRITNALVKTIERADVRTGTEAVGVRRSGKWKVMLKSGEVTEADAVCLAVPAWQAAKLLRECAPRPSVDLASIRYDPILAVNMIVRREEVPEALFGPGFFVSAEGATWPFASLKAVGITEDGKAVRFRVFISGVLQPEVFSEDDAVIERRILEFAAARFGITPTPSFVSVERYPRALPQYGPGHAQTVAAVVAGLEAVPGLFLTGNGYHGFGISDCVREALKTGSRMTDGNGSIFEF